MIVRFLPVVSIVAFTSLRCVTQKAVVDEPRRVEIFPSGGPFGEIVDVVAPHAPPCDPSNTHLVVAEHDELGTTLSVETVVNDCGVSIAPTRRPFVRIVGASTADCPIGHAFAVEKRMQQIETSPEGTDVQSAYVVGCEGTAQGEAFLLVGAPSHSPDVLPPMRLMLRNRTTDDVSTDARITVLQNPSLRGPLRGNQPTLP
jgi:hypothetical protein